MWSPCSSSSWGSQQVWVPRKGPSIWWSSFPYQFGGWWEGETLPLLLLSCRAAKDLTHGEALTPKPFLRMWQAFGGCRGARTTQFLFYKLP